MGAVLCRCRSIVFFVSCTSKDFAMNQINGILLPGFMRISGAENPLDDSGVHPESYVVAAALVHKFEACKTTRSLGGGRRQPKKRKTTKMPQPDSVTLQQLQGLAADLEELLDDAKQLERLAKELGTSICTLKDIVQALAAPGRDSRGHGSLETLKTRRGSFEQLRVGHKMQAVVTNVVPFGAFVDLNVGRSGLIPRALMAAAGAVSPHPPGAPGIKQEPGAIKQEPGVIKQEAQLAAHAVGSPDPFELLSIGDLVQVRVHSKDVGKGQVTLALLSVG